MEPQPVETADDPRLAPFREVRDPVRVRTGGRFVAEGRRVLGALLAWDPAAVEAVLVTRAARGALGAALEAVPTGVPVYEAPGPALLATLTGVRFHQGCLALARLPAARRAGDLEAALAPGPRLWLVLEGVSDPDNVGTLFRTAAAFGVDAVLLSPGSASPFYRKALRTSLGTVLSLPHATPATDAAWAEDLDRLARRGVEGIALTPAAEAPPLESALEGAGERVAVLLGSEERGLGPATLAWARHRARIPIRAAVDSLNVAAAGAIALHGLAARR